MEHFKKRLIHQHQKPHSCKLSPKPMGDAEDDASSNSSTSSGSNGIIRTENRKEGSTQLKVARKRAVCRSKFRHNSLKIFKLGTSIPTSLCKSKEPYNVSAEKNLQLCCEASEKKNMKKEDKLIQKESITEQIINSIEGNKQKDNFQRSISANLDYSTKFAGKHNLPAVISEIPVKRRRNSLSRSSEDEQKICGSYNATCDDSEQIKFDDRPHFINYRRKTVIGSETPREYLNDFKSPPTHITHDELNKDREKDTKTIYNDQIRSKLLERISPDSTFTEKETSATQFPLLKHLNNNTPPVFTSSTSKIPDAVTLSLPINITLPHNTSITPIVSTIEKTEFTSQNNNATTKSPTHNFHKNSVDCLQKDYYYKYSSMFPVQTEDINLLKNSDHPINLSVTRHETYSRNFHQLPYMGQYKANSVPLPSPQIEQINKNRFNFPEIQHQICRLQNMPAGKPFELYKSVEESVARSTVQMAYSIMFTKFTVENLIILNYYYKKLLSIMGSKTVSVEMMRILRDVTDEIIVYLSSKLFDKKSPIFKNYTQQIMDFDLEPHRELLKDVIYLIRKNCYDYIWMGHFLMILAKNRTDIPQTFSNHLLTSSQYPSITPQYYSVEDKDSRRKSHKPRGPQTKSRPQHLKLPPYLDPLNNSNNKTENYPSDSRYIPPKASFNTGLPELTEIKMNSTIESKHKTQNDNQVLFNSTKVEKENNFTGNADKAFVNDTVIVKDKSMEVTRGDKEIEIKKGRETDKNDVVVEKIPKYEITGIKTEDDLNLFKELLRQEDKNIYNRILSKIVQVKETTKDVITIDDEEETSTKRNRLREILTKSQPIIGQSSSRKFSTSSKSSEVVIIDDDTEDKSVEDQKLDFNQNFITSRKVTSSNKSAHQEISRTMSVTDHISKTLDKNLRQKKENITNEKFIYGDKIKKRNIDFEVTNLIQHPLEEPKKRDLKLAIQKPYPFKITVGSNPDHAVYQNYQVIESPEVFTPPTGIGRPYLGSQSSTSSICKTPEEGSVMIPRDLISPVTPYSSLSLLSTQQPGVNSNWKSWISEERKKGLLDARQPSHRRQSVETISSVGSDYSPSLDHDDNVKIRIDSKWYRVKKSVMESIPRGKLCYVREKNYLIRYFDDNQLAQFIQNMKINLVSPVASDYLKQIRDRVDGYLNDDIFITPYEVPENNEVIQVSENVSFTKEDYISIPEMYVEEVEKVERFVPKDFLGFYKYVTGYQIVNHHNPISFQTFLMMHNTSGIKIFYKRYLLSILENKYE